jgi:hypothetical protein
MPSKLEFVFRTERGRNLYKGSDLNRLVMTVLSQVGFTEEQGVEIGDHIQQTWNQHASKIPSGSHSWRTTDYNRDYKEGIQVWRRRGQDLVFALHGEKANAVELGWAPPKSSEWGDGIGTYDGEVHDLRPWLLHSGHPQVRHAKPKKDGPSSFATYRFLKFDAPKLSEMLETTAQHMVTMENAKHVAEHQTAMNDADRERMLGDARKKMQHTARSSVGRDESGRIVFRPLDFKDVPPAPDTYGQHHRWIYHGATMQSEVPFKTMRAAMKFIMHQAQFTVFRTITDSESQINRKLFFSRGIAPAKLISDSTSPVVTAAREAIINIMSGKNADGSEKNGSGS